MNTNTAAGLREGVREGMLIIEAISEALVLGAKAGVAPDILLKVLGGDLDHSALLTVIESLSNFSLT